MLDKLLSVDWNLIANTMLGVIGFLTILAMFFSFFILFVSFSVSMLRKYIFRFISLKNKISNKSDSTHGIL